MNLSDEAINLKGKTIKVEGEDYDNLVRVFGNLANANKYVKGVKFSKTEGQPLVEFTTDNALDYASYLNRLFDSIDVEEMADKVIGEVFRSPKFRAMASETVSNYLVQMWDFRDAESRSVKEAARMFDKLLGANYDWGAAEYGAKLAKFKADVLRKQTAQKESAAFRQYREKLSNTVKGVRMFFVHF